MSLRKPNADRVTPPVVGVAGIGGTLGLVIAAAIDAGWNPPKSNRWDDVAIAVLPMLLAGGGAWLGAQKAKATVTPIMAGDQPRDLAGNDLKPVSRTPSTGYIPTRAARPEDRDPHRPPFEVP